MIVVLNHYQGRTILNRVSEKHRAAMLDHRAKHGRSQHAFSLPAIAWRQVLDHLTDVCYGPMGGIVDTMPQSVYSGISRIADAVRRIEGHPALRETGVKGHVGELIPCWVHTDVDPYGYSPYPQGDGWMFAIMRPQHLELHGQAITVWWPDYTADFESDWTFNPAHHLEFLP